MENIHPDEGVQIDPYEKQKQYRIKRENSPSEITDPAGKPCTLKTIQDIQYGTEQHSGSVPIYYGRDQCSCCNETA